MPLSYSIALELFARSSNWNFWNLPSARLRDRLEADLLRHLVAGAPLAAMRAQIGAMISRVP